MRRLASIMLAIAMTACAGPRLPPPNSATAQFDPKSHAIQVWVSGLQPPSSVMLIAPDGTRYPASALSIVSGPHVLYNPPPSISLGFGGFGFSGCCSSFGSGIGVGMPVGQPKPAEVSDQYVVSALIAAPADYAQSWPNYRLEVQVNNRPIMLAAPSPSA